MIFLNPIIKPILNLILLAISYQLFAQDSQDSIYLEDISPYETDIVLNDSDSAYLSFESESETSSYIADSYETLAIERPIVNETKQESIPLLTKSVKRIRFYQKWWFTLILILLISPVVFKYHLNAQSILKKRIDELKNKTNEFKSILKEHDLEYEKKELEYKEKIKEDEILKFHTVGLNKFSDIISKNKEDLKKLGQQFIYELVEYINANSGVIFLIDKDNTFLEVLNSYAGDINKVNEKFKPGEGYIGTCYKEAKTIELENVPETYTKVESGLGAAVPKYIIFIPLIQDENKLGVLELASFKKLEKYKVEFIEKLASNIASALAIQSATDKMQIMLEQSKEQAEEMKAQEEELRQNMEEMQSVQEELQRQKDELAQEKALVDALLINAKEYIYFKDEKSRFIKVSNSMTKLFKVKNVEELYGKSDFDFFTEEHAKPAYEDEQKIIKTGKAIIDKIEKETHPDGRISWVSTSKMPLYNENNEIVGTFGISKDITHSIEMEHENNQRNEELQAQEEELRQNLEEMQTVQEELERQKDDLAQEKALMDTLLSNAKEYIYFKDKKSRFLKVSNSMTNLFKVKNVEELYGKSDFDFFTEEHAKPAYEDEQKIIKTGKAIIDKIEKETHPDGRISWVSTSKMPLYNKNNEIVGTFGISKDITHSIEMEHENKQRNEELQAQEEELRQNLEEMQTIQEELQKRIIENEKLNLAFRKREAELKKTIAKLQKK